MYLHSYQHLMRLRVTGVLQTGSGQQGWSLHLATLSMKALGDREGYPTKNHFWEASLKTFSLITSSFSSVLTPAAVCTTCPQGPAREGPQGSAECCGSTGFSRQDRQSCEGQGSKGVQAIPQGDCKAVCRDAVPMPLGWAAAILTLLWSCILLTPHLF